MKACKPRNFLFTFLALLIFSSAALANDFTPTNTKIGDGSDGRPFAKWVHSPQNIAIEKVELKLRKFAGDGEAYVNLRFGDGEAFESGRRVYIQDNSQNTITFNVGNKSPNGEPLVLNAYNGAFIVTGYRVVYSRDQFIPQGREPVVSQGKRPVFRPLKRNSTPEECEYGDYKEPLIEVSDKESRGGLFSGKYRLFGSVFAACVTEAGYYERGKLKESLDFPATAEYERRSFEFNVRSGRGGAIKVYSADGEVTSVEVDDFLN